MWNLNELLVDGAGWVVTNAFDINNSGAIVTRADATARLAPCC